MNSVDGIITTRTSRVFLHPDGFVLVEVLPFMRQDLNDAVENLSAAIQASDGALRPLLIDIRQSELLDPAARRHYATQPLDAHFTALALLLATSPFGVMMGNVYMKMARHSVPMRLFAEEPQARAWLIKTLI